MRVLRSQMIVAAVVLSVSIVGAQTKITAPKNKYSPSDDVKLGKDAAAQVEQQLPMLRDEAVTSFVSDIGQRLVDAIPAGLAASGIQIHVPGRQRERDQRFRAAGRADVRQSRNDRGGANRRRSRGRRRARAESRRAAARHGPGHQGDAIRDRHDRRRDPRRHRRRQCRAARSRRARSSGSAPRSCATAASTRSRPTSTGRTSWRAAGYDPRDMANMFKTIEKQGGSGGPQWLSDHPNPGNRYAYITQEAQSLHVDERPARHATLSRSVQAHLRTMSPAPSTEEATRNARDRPQSRAGEPNGGRISTNVERPSSRYRHTTRATCSGSAFPRTGANCRGTTPSRLLPRWLRS